MIFVCMCGVVFRPCGHADIIKATNACLESRDRLQRILRLSASEDACRLSGNVITFTHPVNIFPLTDVFSRNSIARFYKIIIRKSIFSFVQFVIQIEFD